MSAVVDGGHEHCWAYVGQGTHFEVVPNSRVRAKPVHKVACDCGQRGIKYGAFTPVMTWPADESKWCTEADHEAAQDRKSPFAKARRP